MAESSSTHTFPSANAFGSMSDYQLRQTISQLSTAAGNVGYGSVAPQTRNSKSVHTVAFKSTFITIKNIRSLLPCMDTYTKDSSSCVIASLTFPNDASISGRGPSLYNPSATFSGTCCTYCTRTSDIAP